MADRTHISSLRLGLTGLDPGSAKAHGQAVAKALHREFAGEPGSGRIEKITVRVSEAEARDPTRLAKRIRAAARRSQS